MRRGSEGRSCETPRVDHSPWGFVFFYDVLHGGHAKELSMYAGYAYDNLAHMAQSVLGF